MSSTTESTSARPRDDIEYYYGKVTKILARAARGATEHERAVAARLVSTILRDHPLPLRWFVGQGTHCKVVPSFLMGDLRAAKQVIRLVALRQDRWFLERERVKVQDDLALSAGYLYFEQHGYALFCPVDQVTCRL